MKEEPPDHRGTTPADALPGSGDSPPQERPRRFWVKHWCSMALFYLLGFLALSMMTGVELSLPMAVLNAVAVASVLTAFHKRRVRGGS